MNSETQFSAEPLSPDEEELRQRRKKIIVTSLVLAVLIYAAVIGLRHFLQGRGEPVDAAGPIVTVVVPGRAQVTSFINATGSLAARREMPVGVVGEGGSVQQVLVEPGDWVQAGQVLARVERSVQAQQVNSQSASVSVAQADARLAQNELERAQSLLGNGFISKADIDRKTATRDQAVARLRVAQAQLGEQQARLGRLDIRSPAAGLVLTRGVEPGQIIGSGNGTLFRIARGGEMEMLAKVSEADLGKLAVGISAQVTPVGGTRSFSGQVWQISPVIDPQSRQGTARIALSHDPQLRPGGFASASISAGSGNLPVLPESALQNDARGSYVLVVNASNIVERRDVSIGQVTSAGASIKSGLNGSEKVVTLAGGFLNVGQKVRPEIAR